MSKNVSFHLTTLSCWLMLGKREMEMEKRRSKGSFLSLFDWNAKSRKKLLWNDPNLPGNPNLMFILVVIFCLSCPYIAYS